MSHKKTLPPTLTQHPPPPPTFKPFQAILQILTTYSPKITFSGELPRPGIYIILRLERLTS